MQIRVASVPNGPKPPGTQACRVLGCILAILFALCLILAAGLCCASEAYREADEIYRIRIRNTAGGLIQVSTDGGRTCYAVGRVTAPANARIAGFGAASYVPQGTVAATAVHGLRIKTGQAAQGFGKAQKPLMFSVTPAEFAHIPQGYGGHVPRSSGILTDIPAGRSIFRGQAPYAGSPVFLQHDQRLDPFAEDYVPVVGDVFVIVVRRPRSLPSEIRFDNRAGGRVTAVHLDGRSEIITEVARPVRGVGRYDGTTFTGVGAINTNHGGVITISTAPICPPGTREGGEVETRGGFMIQPYYHVYEQGESSPQVMVVGPPERSKPVIEGTAPLFRGCISPAFFPDRPECSYRAQVKIDDGDWEDVPRIVGRVDDAFTAGYLTQYFAKLGAPRQIRDGVTAIRLLFPEHDAGLVARDLAREASEYARRAIQAGAKAEKGTVQLHPQKTPGGAAVVSFYVDGACIYVSNRHPYICQWDSARVPNGFHEVRIETVPDSGARPTIETRTLLVLN